MAKKCPKDSLVSYKWKSTDQSCPARMGFMCTRPRGHSGLHHAHGCEGQCYAVWSDEPAEENAVK